MEYFQLTDVDKDRIEKLAYLFIEGHYEHVWRSIVSSENAVAPSGNDLFNPSLWKPMHWAWFINKKREPIKSQDV